jgi:hypothetical protein
MVGAVSADAGEEDGRQEPPVGQAAPQLVEENGDAPVPRRVLDEPHDRLEVGAEAHRGGRRLGAESRQLSQERQVGQAQRRGAGRRLQEPPPCRGHGMGSF